MEEEPLETDKWILDELSKVIKESLEGYQDYNFFIPANRVREFIWNIFAPHYIELVKQRAYGIDFSDEERDAAIYTLHKVLKTVLKLLAPITPFITEFLWEALYSKESIHKEKRPKALSETSADLNKALEEVNAIRADTQPIIDFNSNVWNEKKAKGLHLPDSIKIDVPKDLEKFKKDLVAMHHLEI